ncbi:hypothetical protein EYF80_015902 [Liparis tanakae]|uniref:Uncharacterized protein n=1 Tax=Liparis tanakae TaxID=230148 RepID=A0A4Z2I8Z9_9TELE|nr:hypothetical protein EYF80_015902 [Liparis tanakae]
MPEIDASVPEAFLFELEPDRLSLHVSSRRRSAARRSARVTDSRHAGAIIINTGAVMNEVGT